MVYKIFKRVSDFIISLVGLIVLSPLFLIIIILIKIDSKGPIFFKQKRVGKNKKHFMMLKFRTMRTTAPKDMPTHMLENPDQWITKLGSILRKSSLDELPQLINILKGDMAIVGPRPALWNQEILIAERDKYNCHNYYPGLTGYAQIMGRDELSIEAKAKLDGYYCRNISFLLDTKIFFKTIFSIFKRDGIVEGKINDEDKKEEQE